MLLLVFLTVFSRGSLSEEDMGVPTRLGRRSLNRFLSEEDMDAAPMGVPTRLGRRNLEDMDAAPMGVPTRFGRRNLNRFLSEEDMDAAPMGVPTRLGRRNLEEKISINSFSLTSTYSSHYPASNCFDGNTNTMCHGGESSGDTLTAHISTSEVTRVRIKNRNDCCQDRIRDAEVKVDGRLCGVVQSTGSVIDVICSQPLSGTVVTLKTSQYLNIMQLEIFKNDDGSWTKCAGQWETCTCNGIVKYGEGSNWAEKAATGSIGCNNAEFGDPSIGQAKDCFCDANCSFRAVETSECPANANLKRCYARDMISGEMCESDNGDTVNQQNLNNCNPGSWDIFKYECFAAPAVIEPDDLGDCDVNTVSTWNGNIEATYISCDGIPAAATYIVKVSEITGIKHCPLFQDWVFTVGCPSGVCPLDVGFDISLDACDLMMAIATGGASMAAKTAAKELGKQIGKQMSRKWQREMAQRMADNIGGEAEDNIRDSEVGKGLCADIEKSIGVHIQCILQSEASVTIPGLEEVLAILNGGVSLKLMAGMEYVIASNSIRNVALEMGFGYAIPEAAPAGWAITILAKTIDEIPSTGCNRNDPRKIAKEMTTGWSITPSGVSGQMQITCGNSQLFETFEEIGKKLEEGKEVVEEAFNNASGEVRENFQKAQEHVEDLCEHVKSQKNECRDVTEEVCNWVSGRRQLKGEGSDDRRMLFGGPIPNPLRWVCDNVVSQVCEVVDVLHC